MFRFPRQLTQERILERRSLVAAFDEMRNELDTSGTMDAMDRYSQQAVEMLVGGRARAAFDLSLEPARSREAFGNHLWCQQALLARRLVKQALASSTSISAITPSEPGTPRHPALRRIRKGLQPLLPLFTISSPR